ncbi:M20 family metallo-hydrolase [Thalassobacillus sp. CUG 92003]|uniref:M20 family metallo-hydrolase n=1 Tax=Thalassobacillus sp. CUG 92003 TaxID=2736641 RepID=UPI0015E63E85|nr:M20 family metallo-hydrolase [Thalassobacillus sp. CUG 92003]
MTVKDLQQRLMTAYDTSLNGSGVSGERLASRLAALAQIGWTGDGGSRRLGFSSEEREAKDLVKQWMENAGLHVSEDGAGNIFGRLNGGSDDEPVVMSGSHVDTVPNGGHFDGVLGVLCALEVVEAWNETGFTPDYPFEVAVFTDEEGSRFKKGFTGSEAMVGDLDVSHMATLTDGEGLTFEEVLEQAGLTKTGLLEASREGEIRAFMEVHIEQGKQLEKAQQPVGIVSGIAGPSWVELSFKGVAGHAGKTPMHDRHDALVMASEFIRDIPSFPEQVSSTAVATVGKLEVIPNGVNVIPGEVKLYVDVRDINEGARDELVTMITGHAEHIAKQHGMSVHYKVNTRIKPVPVDETLTQYVVSAVEQADIKPIKLPSGAAHDAMIIGRHIPVAMLFVRSRDGISHNPEEWSSLNDCVMAVHVLKRALEHMK